MKKFDLAIYEVEEMNQKELTEVNGGVAFWTIAGVIIAFVALVYTIYRDSRPHRKQFIQLILHLLLMK